MSRLTTTFRAAIFATPALGMSVMGQSVLAEVDRDSLGLVILRSLPTLTESHSVAITELDPEAENFGEMISEFELPDLEHPLHHFYYSPTGRLYSTGLDPDCSLAEVTISEGDAGLTQISDVECLDTEGQVVGEDIMWTQSNGTEYMFVTFMGGRGQDNGGTVGVFDSESNDLVKTIEALKSEVDQGDPYIMYPHGISAFDNLMVVASTIHPDLATGVGDTITIIDLNELEPIQTITIQDAMPVGFPSSPVEVLFVRPEMHEDIRPAILVNTMFGFETWVVPYDVESRTFGEPEVVYSGAENGTGVPLEFYSNGEELFISHALPGVVKRYDLSKLPELVPSGPDIIADPGAHHMIFFTTGSGRDVIAVQNNLLNLGDAKTEDPTDVDFIAGLNSHTITVHDLATGERLGTIDFRERYGKGVENVEGLFGSGFTHHH